MFEDKSTSTDKGTAFLKIPVMSSFHSIELKILVSFKHGSRYLHEFLVTQFEYLKNHLLHLIKAEKLFE